MTRYIISLIAVIVAFPLSAQITFERLYNFNNEDCRGYSVVQNIDGGYILAGQAGNNINTGKMLVFRTNPFGDTIWSRKIEDTIYFTSGAIGFSCLLSQDSTIIVCGDNYYDVFLVNYSQDGDPLWSKRIGVPQDTEIGNSIKQTIEGGYIITGQHYPYSGRNNVFLARTDQNGDTVWTKKIGEFWVFECGNDVVQTLDSGFLVVGYSKNDSIWPAFNKVLLVKTNANGDLQWIKRLGADSEVNEAASVVLNNDQGFTIAGMTGNEILLMRFNQYGDTVWRKSLLPPGWTYAYAESIRIMPDQGYILTGTGILGVFLMRTDSSGNMIWCRDFPQPWTHGFEVSLTSDSGFIITGYSSLSTNYEVYLVKTDENGIITGEAEIPLSTPMAPWPNPCREIVTIPVQEYPESVMVINSFGQPVKIKYQESENQVQIQMAELPPGLYSVIIITNKGKNHLKIIHQ